MYYNFSDYKKELKQELQYFNQLSIKELNEFSIKHGKKFNIKNGEIVAVRCDYK